MEWLKKTHSSDKVQGSTGQNNSFQCKFVKCLAKCPGLYWDFFFKTENSVSNEKKEYWTMGEGEVS